MMDKSDEFKIRIYQFTLKLIKFIEELPRDNVSRRIGDQLLRSGTSIIGNYVEGKSSASRKEYINFFAISLKSTNESKLWIALLRDSEKTSKDKTEYFLRELDEYSKIFGKSIITLKNKK